MVNAVQSAIGIVRSLLPIGAGGPKLPDVPSFLDHVTSMLQGLLGTSGEESKPAEEAQEPSPAKPAVEIAPAPHDDSPKVPKKSGDQVVRDREQTRREAERRSEEEAPGGGVAVQLEQIRRILEGMKGAAPGGPGGDLSSEAGPTGSAASTIQDLLQALDELQKRAGLSVEAAPDKTAGLLCPASEPVPAEAQPPLAAQAPAFLPLPEAPAKGDVLSPIDGLATTPAPGTDPMAAPAALAAPSPVIVEALTIQEVEIMDRATADRPGPAVGGIAETRSGATDPPGATPSAGAEGPEGTDMVERIVQAARLTQSRGASRIKIALNPPHLGELKVDLLVRQHVLHGTLQAENPSAREMILSQLQSLKDSLAEQGIQVGEFQVQVDPSFGQSAQQDPEDGRSRSGAASYAMGGTDAVGASVAERVRSARMQVFDVVA